MCKKKVQVFISTTIPDIESTSCTSVPVDSAPASRELATDVAEGASVGTPPLLNCIEIEDKENLRGAAFEGGSRNVC